MEARPVLAFGRDGTIRKMFVDERFPARALVIAPIQAEVYRKTDGATHIMIGNRIVRERIRILTMGVMAIDIVAQTAHMLAQRVIKNQERVSLRTADRFRLLEQILNATVIDAVLEPWGFREEAGEVGFISTVQHTAGDIGQAFVVQNDQAGQVMLEMAKLAPIRKKISKDRRVGGHDGGRGDNGKLHETCALSSKGWDRA